MEAETLSCLRNQYTLTMSFVIFGLLLSMASVAAASAVTSSPAGQVCYTVFPVYIIIALFIGHSCCILLYYL